MAYADRAGSMLRWVASRATPHDRGRRAGQSLAMQQFDGTLLLQRHGYRRLAARNAALPRALQSRWQAADHSVHPHQVHDGLDAGRRRLRNRRGDRRAVRPGRRRRRKDRGARRTAPVGRPRVRRERHGPPEQRTFHTLEIPYGRFERTLHLPDGTDTAAASASYHDGLLEITLPKRQPRQVPITRQGAGDDADPATP